MTPQLKRHWPAFFSASWPCPRQPKKRVSTNAAYTETLKFTKMQLLTNELQRNVQEEAAKVPQEEIEAYYKIKSRGV